MRGREMYFEALARYVSVVNDGRVFDVCEGF